MIDPITAILPSFVCGLRTCALASPTPVSMGPCGYRTSARRSPRGARFGPVSDFLLPRETFGPGTGDRGVYERHHVVKMTTRRSIAFALGKSSEHAGLAYMRPEVLASRRASLREPAVCRGVSLHPARGSQAQGCKRYAVGSVAVVWPAPITASLYGAHVRGRSAFGGRRR
jgi:hypothetical protein